MMDDFNIFEHAISNVNFIENENEILLFIYITLEVNTNDVRFYLDEIENKKYLILHYPSDNLITIPIESDIIYEKLSVNKQIMIFETDTIDGELSLYYNANS